MKAKCLKVLGWIECAPTPLTTLEMEQAILVDATNYKKPPLTTPRVLGKGDFSRLCGPIVEVVDGDHLQFVHFTAATYIFSEAVHGYIDRKLANKDLAACLLAYLSSGVLNDCQDNRQDSTGMDEKIISGYYRLFHYAALQWPSVLLPIYRHRHVPKRIRKLLLRLASVGNNAHFEAAEIEVHHRTSHAAVDSVCRPLFHKKHFKDEPRADFKTLCSSYLFQNDDSQWDGRTMGDESSWTRLDPLRTSEILVCFNVRLRKLACGSQDVDLVANLRKHYGLGIFKCRFLWCARSLRGFDTNQNLHNHESDHQCGWQCLIPNCSSGGTNFLTKGMLDEHLELIHGRATNSSQSQLGITSTSFDTAVMHNLQRTEIEALVKDAVSDTNADSDTTLGFVQKMCSLPCWEGRSTYSGIATPLEKLVIENWDMPVMALMLKALNRHDIGLNEKHLEHALFHGSPASVAYVTENLKHGSHLFTQMWKAIMVHDKLNFGSWLKFWLRSGFGRESWVDCLGKNHVFVILGNKHDHVWENIETVLEELGLEFGMDHLHKMLSFVAKDTLSIRQAGKLIDFGANIEYRNFGATALQTAARSKNDPQKATTFMAFFFAKVQIRQFKAKVLTSATKSFPGT